MDRPVRNLGIELGIGFIAALCMSILFIWIGDEVLEKDFAAFDTTIQNAIRELESPLLTAFFSAITFMGNVKTTVFIFLFVAAFLIFKLNHFWESAILFVNLIGGWFLSFWLKGLYERSRPDLNHLVHAGGYSFPSGHAMISLTFFGMLAYILYINLRENNKKTLPLMILFSIFILLVGISRIYLGVHFPSDILGGFLSGAVWLIACIFGLRTIRYYKSR